MCTSGFLLVSHIGLVCPGAKVHGGSVRNSNGLWDETKVNARHCLEVRALVDAAGPSAVVAELSGDLNKEHLYAAGAASYGFTAVGMSRRRDDPPQPWPSPQLSPRRPSPTPTPDQARRQRPRLPSRHPQRRREAGHRGGVVPDEARLRVLVGPLLRRVVRAPPRRWLQRCPGRPAAHARALTMPVLMPTPMHRTCPRPCPCTCPCPCPFPCPRPCACRSRSCSRIRACSAPANGMRRPTPRASPGSTCWGAMSRPRCARVLRRAAFAVPGPCARVSSARRRRLWAAHPSQRERPAHWAPSNRLGCPSQPTRPRRQPSLPPPSARAGASGRVRLPRV